ncbi:hypothetical protein BKN38_00215 [Helicobacter sp. CLO-3]|nr:hypothetical protein BA723_01615 [Helicobacter sp. CLO-3]OHU85865.1 hypothetical protein BKN38_00215 [Helicobacter sp. CLO-3]
MWFGWDCARKAHLSLNIAWQMRLMQGVALRFGIAFGTAKHSSGAIIDTMSKYFYTFSKYFLLSRLFLRFSANFKIFRIMWRASANLDSKNSHEAQT